MAKETKKVAQKKSQEKKGMSFTVTAREWTEEELKDAFSHL